MRMLSGTGAVHRSTPLSAPVGAGFQRRFSETHHPNPPDFNIRLAEFWDSQPRWVAAEADRLVRGVDGIGAEAGRLGEDVDGVCWCKPAPTGEAAELPAPGGRRARKGVG